MVADINAKAYSYFSVTYGSMTANSQMAAGRRVLPCQEEGLDGFFIELISHIAS